MIKVGQKITFNHLVGVIRYIGIIENRIGNWVGIELDKPNGSTDGSIYGKRYFKTEKNRGLFINLSRVEQKVKENILNNKQFSKTYDVNNENTIIEDFKYNTVGENLDERLCSSENKILRNIRQSEKNSVNKFTDHFEKTYFVDKLNKSLKENQNLKTNLNIFMKKCKIEFEEMENKIKEIRIGIANLVKIRNGGDRKIYYVAENILKSLEEENVDELNIWLEEFDKIMQTAGVEFKLN